MDSILQPNQISKLLQPFMQHAQSNTLHHALLFYGAEKQSKLASAKCFAQYLLCSNKSQNGYCGVCKSCYSFQRSLESTDNTHPDCFCLGEDEDASVGIDDIREIINFLSLTPHYGQKKIVIINRADKLNRASQNAILKILEEPPSYGSFILIAENTKLLLPTILSRCLQYRFKEPSFQESIAELKAQLAGEQYDEQTLKAVHTLANGNAEKAKMWLISPVWQNKDAIVERFVFGQISKEVALQQILSQHALEALYLIYYGVSDLIKYINNQQTEHIYILNVRQLQSSAGKYTQINCFRYLRQVQQAIQVVQEIAGINKLLLFQNLYNWKCMEG